MGAITMDFAAVSKPRRACVDFASVPPSQWRMHDRLENWARWARGSQGQCGQAGSPMFNLYRSSEVQARRYGEEMVVPIDKEDAIRIAKAVGHLPQMKRKALHWYYLAPRNPSGMARELGVELQDLAQLVKDARTVLIGWV